MCGACTPSELCCGCVMSMSSSLSVPAGTLACECLGSPLEGGEYPVHLGGGRVRTKNLLVRAASRHTHK